MRGSFCSRHRPTHHESDKFVRAIFHDETGRLRNWSGPEPANRGSARRFFDLGESSWAWLRSAFALAEIKFVILSAAKRSRRTPQNYLESRPRDASIYLGMTVPHSV